MSQHAFKTAIVLFSLGALPSQARSALESLALEAARAKQVVTKLPESVVGAEERRSLEQQQATVEELLRANRTHAALHVLLRLSRYVDAQGFRALHAADIKQGLDALERDWAASGIERRGQAAAYERPAGGGAFAAARALSESAYYESRIVYEASKLYGTQVGADAGYFYLGESRALMDYALFCRGLGAPTARRPPELRPLAPFLATLETELLEAYGRDTATPEHAAFARANGSLKLARELLGERSRLGALYQYLLAELALGLAGAAEAPDAAKLRERAESLERRLAGSKADHSLGQAFVELARSGLERAQGAADPKPLLQNARVLLERVLPAYLDVAGEDLR